MPARLIHRFGAADRLYRRAVAGTPDTLLPGDVALFEAADPAGAQSVRDASWFCPDDPPGAPRIDLGACQSGLPAAVAAIAGRGARAFLIGGTVADAASFVAAMPPQPGAATLLISARLDLDPTLLPHGPRIAVGTHDLLPAASVSRWRGSGGAVLPATSDPPAADRLDACLTPGRALCILDMGVLDTGHAAGSPTVTVGGLSVLEFLSVVAAIAARCVVTAAAVFGLSPERDARGHTERAAAEALNRLAASGAPPGWAA